MTGLKKVLAIMGSASKGSVNEKILENISALAAGKIKVSGFDLTLLPHFNPSDSINDPPAIVEDLRKRIEDADGVIICTPEFVFSIPALLKNAIEWCVATTVFSNKPVCLVTASSSGIKGHEQLQLIMNTVGANFKSETTLLISGVKTKVNMNGEITDPHTKEAILKLVQSFIEVLYKKGE